MGSKTLDSVASDEPPRKLRLDSRSPLGGSHCFGGRVRGADREAVSVYQPRATMHIFQLFSRQQSRRSASYFPSYHSGCTQTERQPPRTNNARTMRSPLAPRPVRRASGTPQQQLLICHLRWVHATAEPTALGNHSPCPGPLGARPGSRSAPQSDLRRHPAGACEPP